MRNVVAKNRLVHLFKVIGLLRAIAEELFRYSQLKDSLPWFIVANIGIEGLLLWFMANPVKYYYNLGMLISLMNSSRGGFNWIFTRWVVQSEIKSAENFSFKWLLRLINSLHQISLIVNRLRCSFWYWSSWKKCESTSSRNVVVYENLNQFPENHFWQAIIICR